MVKPYRIFLAVQPPEDILNQIELYLLPLKKKYSGVQWSRGSFRHITLQFIGEVDLEEMQTVKEVMAYIVNNTSAFNIKLNGVNAFPNISEPKIFLISLQKPFDLLNQLVEKVKRQLTIEGFEMESRPYQPHLTLARCTNSQKAKSILKDLCDIKFELPAFDVEEMILFMQEVGSLKPYEANFKLSLIN